MNFDRLLQSEVQPKESELISHYIGQYPTLKPYNTFQSVGLYEISESNITDRALQATHQCITQAKSWLI